MDDEIGVFRLMRQIDRAVENFDIIWPILERLDMTANEKLAEEAAIKEHVKLLKQNMPGALYGERVPTIKSLKQKHMRAHNLLVAIAVSNIVDSLQEGETVFYKNLAISKTAGKIMVREVTNTDK